MPTLDRRLSRFAAQFEQELQSEARELCRLAVEWTYNHLEPEAAVFDRHGRRLGTVNLGYVPEAGQGTMTQQLTALIKDVLRLWEEPLPRLCYVTDAGDSETSYYKKHLRTLRHPLMGQWLHWQWVVDYYYVSERLTVMAEALFGKGQRAWAWLRKMQKLLLNPGGAGRVLHSAAALRSQRKLRGNRLTDTFRHGGSIGTMRGIGGWACRSAAASRCGEDFP